MEPTNKLKACNHTEHIDCNHAKHVDISTGGQPAPDPAHHWMVLVRPGIGQTATDTVTAGKETIRVL
jgi:hypothetical protein